MRLLQKLRMVAGVPQAVFGSAALLLATTTTTVVQSAGASSSSSSTTFFDPSTVTLYSSTFSEACADETVSCLISDTCYSCSYLDEVDTRQLAACIEDISEDDPDSSTEHCSYIVAALCCFDKLLDNNCVDNDKFVDLQLCKAGGESCPFDDITCDYNGGAAGSRSNAVVSVGHASFAAFACALFLHCFALL